MAYRTQRFNDNILHRKANWIGHTLSRNCLLRDSIEGQMTEVKGVRRRTQFLNDLETADNWELNEEAGDQKSLKRQFFTRT